MQLVIINGHGIVGNSVLDSQVVPYARGLARRYPTTLVSLDRPWRRRSAPYREARRSLAAGEQDGELQLAFGSGLPFVGPPSLTLEAAHVHRLLRRRLGGPRERLVLQGRGPLAAAVAARVAAKLAGRHECRVVLDERGAVAEELRARRGATTPLYLWRARVLDRCERRIYHEADGIICVTESLARYLSQRYGARADGSRPIVVPTAVDLDRFRPDQALRLRARRELGWSDSRIVVYSGTLGLWHADDLLLQAFLRLHAVDPAARFLVLTRDRAAGEALAAQAPAGTCRVLALAPAEVPRHLPAGDLALLLRRPSPIHEVASPTKFAEYLACGVPVVASPGIGDTSEIVRREGVGLVLDEREEWIGPALAMAGERLERVRVRCRAVAEQLFGLDMHVGRLAEYYEQLFRPAGTATPVREVEAAPR